MKRIWFLFVLKIATFCQFNIVFNKVFCSSIMKSIEETKMEILYLTEIEREMENSSQDTMLKEVDKFIFFWIILETIEFLQIVNQYKNLIDQPLDTKNMHKYHALFFSLSNNIIWLYKRQYIIANNFANTNNLVAIIKIHSYFKDLIKNEQLLTGLSMFFDINFFCWLNFILNVFDCKNNSDNNIEISPIDTSEDPLKHSSFLFLINKLINELRLLTQNISTIIETLLEISINYCKEVSLDFKYNIDPLEELSELEWIVEGFDKDLLSEKRKEFLEKVANAFPKIFLTSLTVPNYWFIRRFQLLYSAQEIKDHVERLEEEIDLIKECTKKSLEDLKQKVEKHKKKNPKDYKTKPIIIKAETILRKLKQNVLLTINSKKKEENIESNQEKSL